jgi:hypothetical protein
MNYVLKTWWGLQTLDNFGRVKGPVNYSDNPETAKKCFSAKSQETCDPVDCTLKRNMICAPKDTSVWTIPGSSKINNSLTFEMFTLKKNILVYNFPDNFDRYFRILESDKIIVIHFQSGFIIDINTPEIENVINQLAESFDFDKQVVMCGHSFGCVMAQVLACKLIDLKKDISKVFVVGSAPYQWAAFRTVNTFIKSYYPRFVFFGSMEQTGPKEYHTDVYLHESYLGLRHTFENFPLMMLSQTAMKLFQTLPEKDTTSSGIIYTFDDSVRLHQWSFYSPLIFHYIEFKELSVNNFGKNKDIDSDIRYLLTL